MSLGVSAYSTADLFRMINDGTDYGEDFNYKATWCLIGRWRKGVDLEPLISLLESEKSSERQRGAWYLEEAIPPAEIIGTTAAKLATDSIGYCRWAFVMYALNSGLYSREVANLLAKCMLDLDLYVRANTIFWAILAEDDEFEDFCEVVASGAGKSDFEFRDPRSNTYWLVSEEKRVERGISIARRLRAEEPIEDIRQSMPEEDNYVFDALEFKGKVIARGLERKKQRKAEQTPEA